MVELSVVIPARNEPHLQRTIDDLLDKAQGSIEVIVVLDGYWPSPAIRDHVAVTLLHEPEPKGMRPAINSAASMARGKYLMKCDAHCLFDEGFDVKLAAACEPNWTAVPRRYNLRSKDWSRGDKLYEFQYISSPDDPNYTFKGCNWPEFADRVKGQRIVDLMTTQGSCWFMHRAQFESWGGLDAENYGTMGREAQEVCLKTWLSGGRMVLNRNTWYAHWKRGRNERTYAKPRECYDKSKDFVVDCWTNSRWPGQTRDLAWLLKKFKPVPSWHQKESLAANRFIQEKFDVGHAGKYPRKIKGMNRDRFCKMLAELGYKVGCEVGVERGWLASLWFEHIPDVKMYLVDPYCKYKGARVNRRPHSKSREEAHRRMEGKDVTWIEKVSMEAIKDVPDGSLDFVYIDGNHTYDYVMQDLIEWSKKVRVGGIISGHDYYCHSRSGCRVKLAVDDYVRAHHICPVFITDTRRNHVYRADKHASFFWVKT